MDRHPDISRVLKEHGLRSTRQRRVIFSALRQTDTHPTADELLGIVRHADGGISLATVYNTLDALCERGLVHRLPSLDGSRSCRFDATLHDHAHVVLGDGRVIDVPAELGQRLVRVDPSALSRLARTLGVDDDQIGVRVSFVVDQHRD